MNRAFAAAAALFVTAVAGSLQAGVRTIEMAPGENWWGVANFHGSSMPFNAKTSLKIDIRKDGRANQYASLMVSDKGRAIWCEEQAEFKIEGGKMLCTATRILNEAFCSNSPYEIILDETGERSCRQILRRRVVAV